jgi:hypothetical protein
MMQPPLSPYTKEVHGVNVQLVTFEAKPRGSSLTSSRGLQEAEVGRELGNLDPIL